MLKKTDIVLIIFFLIFAASFNFILYAFQNSGAGEPMVIINVNGATFKTIPLNEDGIYEISDGMFNNVLTVQNGKAYMTEADCHDQICVHQRPISFSNETIVCLPNKVVVEVENTEVSEFDAISQ